MAGLKRRVKRIEGRIKIGLGDLGEAEAAEIFGFLEPRLKIVEDGGSLSPEEWATWARYTKRLREAWV